MIKALLLIFDPIATWEGILRARRGMVSILVVYLLPLLLLTSACEGYGLVHWGKWQGETVWLTSRSSPFAKPWSSKRRNWSCRWQ